METVAYRPRQLNDDAWILLPEDLAATLTLSGRESVPTEMATQDDFQVLRIIGELKISGKGQDYFVFTPPALLQLRLQADDLNRAKRRGKPLALAFWYQGPWVRLGNGDIPAEARADGENWAYFILKEMPDPWIAVGT